jgi:hypothetical protein
MKNPYLFKDASQREFSISLERLLFGAIGLNLIYLMCFTIYIGGYAVFTIIDLLFRHYLRGLTLFGLGVGGLAIVSQLAQLFAWGARGFIESLRLRIVFIGVFFLLYGISGVQSGVVDGYVALGTVGITLLVIIFTHWRQVPLSIRRSL